MPEVCQLCHGLQRKDSYPFRLSIECKPDELVQSAEINQCPFCAILLKGLRLMEDGNWSLQHVSTLYGYGFRGDSETLTLEVYFIDERPRIVLEFFYVMDADRNLILENSCCIAQLPTQFRMTAIRPRRFMSDPPASEKALDWVKSKLEACTDNHECYSRLETPLPHRILALDASSEPVSVKIVENTSARSHRYAALSHCWGQVLRCMLTNANLEDSKAGIPWEELPQTFQDAIHYCLRLNIHYLWIDSLCILQDDPDDWQLQSAKMADIYQNSYITLAATAAASGNVGLFPMEPRLVQDPTFRVTDSRGDSYGIGIRRRLFHWTFPPSEASTRETPLLTRGWVLQERLLSPRVLHFCREELVWECGKDTVCQCGSMPILPSMKQHFAFRSGQGANTAPNDDHGTSNPYLAQFRSILRWAGIPSRADANDSDDEDYAVFTGQIREDEDWLSEDGTERQFRGALKRANRDWMRIVEDYSTLNLTRDTDRLPALSGLAARMPPILGKYYAGLWEMSVRRQLTWRVDHPPPDLPITRNYRGPSWSWVSVDANVRFWDERDMMLPPPEAAAASLARSTREPLRRQTEAMRETRRQKWRQWNKITKCTVKTDGKNPFGEVSSAALVAQGLLQQAYIVGKYGDEDGLELQIRYKQCNSIKASRPLPFFPDYYLEYSERRDNRFFLFKIFPQVCLVLVEALNSTSRHARIFQRIGIIKMANEIEMMHGVDWMEGAEETIVFTIV